MVAAGYIIEQVIWLVLSLGYVIYCVYQFLLWRLPENVDHVKTVQKIFIRSSSIHNLTALILFIDARSLYGIYTPQIVVIITILVIQLPLIGYILWAREVARVTIQVKSNSTSNSKAIPLWKIFIGYMIFQMFCIPVIYVSFTLDNLSILGILLILVALFITMCAFFGARLLKLMRKSLLGAEKKDLLKSTPAVPSSPGLKEDIEREKASQKAKNRMTKKVKGLLGIAFLLTISGLYLLANWGITFNEACAAKSPDVYNPSIIIWLMVACSKAVAFVVVSNGSLGYEKDDESRSGKIMRALSRDMEVTET
jgi:hypothetical protein